MPILSLLLLVGTPFVTSDVVFRIPDAELIPEGLAYDARARTFFVSSTFTQTTVAIKSSRRGSDITDTMSGDIYRISREQDRLERWSSIGDKTFPNGIDISADGRTLFVATGAGITRVNIDDGTVTTVTGFETDKPPVIDGLYFYKQSKDGAYDKAALSDVVVMKSRLATAGLSGRRAPYGQQGRNVAGAQRQSSMPMGDPAPSP